MLVSTVGLYISLVPRPFMPPVFVRLQYANTEGEGLENLITWSQHGWHHEF